MRHAETDPIKAKLRIFSGDMVPLSKIIANFAIAGQVLARHFEKKIRSIILFI